MRAVFPEILTLLGNACGTLKPTPEMVASWESLLSGYSDDDLRKAARHVARQTHFGAPTVGHIVEAIEGRVEAVRIPVTDCWNRAILRPDGSPAYTTELRRVFPDGRSLPAEIQHPLSAEDYLRISGTPQLSDFHEAMDMLGLTED